MDKTICRTAQCYNFLNSLEETQKKILNNTHNKQKKQERDIFFDSKNIEQTATKSQQKRYDAIRSSQLFQQQRKATFVKFNDRIYECRGLSYEDVFKKVLKNKKHNPNHANRIYSKGTMNVVQLWSQKKLNQILGNLPCPRDRLNVLKMYPKKNNNLHSVSSSKRILTE